MSACMCASDPNSPCQLGIKLAEGHALRLEERLAAYTRGSHMTTGGVYFIGHSKMTLLGVVDYIDTEVVLSSPQLVDYNGTLHDAFKYGNVGVTYRLPSPFAISRSGILYSFPWPHKLPEAL